MSKGLSSHKPCGEISDSIDRFCVEGSAACMLSRVKLRSDLRWKVDERVGDNVFAFIWGDLYESEAS